VTMLTAEKPKWFEGGWIYTAPRVKKIDMNGKTLDEVVVDMSSFSKGVLEASANRVIIRLDGSVIE